MQLSLSVVEMEKFHTDVIKDALFVVLSGILINKVNTSQVVLNMKLFGD